MAGRFMGTYFQAVFAMTVSTCFLALLEIQTETCRSGRWHPSLIRRASL